jgi:hypothetical protein
VEQYRQGKPPDSSTRALCLFHKQSHLVAKQKEHGEGKYCFFFTTKYLFHARSVLYHAVNLLHGTDGFISPQNEVLLRNFIELKNSIVLGRV